MIRPPPLSARDALAALVAFPTVSRDSNLPLIDWVETFLAGWGAECRRTYDDESRKANLLATFGPGDVPGIVLSGHTDVVPANEPSWVSDPFTLLERDGKGGSPAADGTPEPTHADPGATESPRLPGTHHEGLRYHGRGTADMKGFLAAALAVVPQIARAAADASPGRRLRCPIHLALSYDEEVGCLGAPRMIDDLLAHHARPSVAIVGEPTSMRPVVGHKSVNVFRTRITGRPAHSSQPHLGAGAILAAGRLIEVLWKLGEEARSHPESQWGYAPPWTTVQVGTIQGGTALNILPAECEFQWEYRALPDRDQDGLLRSFEGEARETVLPVLREFAPEADIRTECEARIPPFLPEPGGRAEALAIRLLGTDAGPGKVVSFGTEAGLFQQAGISTVVCGPGSIDQAHRPNEFIEASQMDACERFLRALVGEARADEEGPPAD